MPTFSELYPICLLLIAFLTTGWLIHHTYPSPADDKPRDIQIDGLRGLLAFGVMNYHYFGIRHLIFNGELLFGRTSKITALLGVWTVPIFFAITAYLFSQRLFRMENHQGRTISKFLLGRIFRLIPTSLLACVLFLLANLVVYTDLQDPNLLLHNWKVLLNASLSSIRRPASGPDSNLLAPWAWPIACGPQWSLHFEWIFYLSLAALSLFTFKKQSVLLPVMIIIVLLVGIQGTRDFFKNWDFMTWAFVPGLILGLTSKYWKNSRYLSNPLTAAIAITAVITSAFYDKLKIKIPANTLFLAVILSNNTATRLLESKLVRSLGETTYSLYLLHGIVQYITLKWIVTLTIARSMPEWLWWLTCVLQVVVIVLLARLSFEFVEKPGIEIGKRFYTWLMNLIERRAQWLLNWI
jgi:peptidoglycan/LPS O-acetylase OafA/YrhL